MSVSWLSSLFISAQFFLAVLPYADLSLVTVFVVDAVRILFPGRNMCASDENKNEKYREKVK
jgi:hypothetical protein